MGGFCGCGWGVLLVDAQRGQSSTHTFAVCARCIGGIGWVRVSGKEQCSTRTRYESAAEYWLTIDVEEN